MIWRFDWRGMIAHCVLLGVLLAALAGQARSADLTIDIGTPQTLSIAALLARPDAATITVPMDASYNRAMTYRAVPLRALLGVTALPEGQDLQLVATDGFVTNLGQALVFPPAGKGAVPWLAIEPPDQPWPKTPGGDSTGPFYLVWLDPAASGIMREQWPFAVVKIGLAPSIQSRWPQLAVDDAVPQDSLVRGGQMLVQTQCMVCHTVAGAGDAAVGPDLNRPHSPTEYFQPWAFKAYIRNPASLRSWSGMKMPGFPEDVLSDQDVDAIVSYLQYLAERRQ